MVFVPTAINVLQMTKKAFENAIVVLFALGGSTNGVLHLLALAKEADVQLSIDDFNIIGKDVPMLGNLAPSGKYNWADVDDMGGLPRVMSTLAQAGMLHTDCLTVTGDTVAQNLDGIDPIGVEDMTNQDVLWCVSKPWAPSGNHISVLRGSLAPEGAVIKLSGKTIRNFKGPAKVFDSETATFAGITAGEVVAGDVVICRYEGPRGAPGMPEMLSLTSALVGVGLGKECALPQFGVLTELSLVMSAAACHNTDQRCRCAAKVRAGDRRTLQRRFTRHLLRPCHTRGAGRRSLGCRARW